MSTAERVNLISNIEESLELDAQELVSMLAHELRQPLSAMESLSCYLEIVLPPHEAKARLQVGKMQELLRQTNWILSDAVHFLQAANAHPVLMDWNETLMEIVSEGGAMPGENIEFKLDDSIPPILFDLDQARHLAIDMFIFLRKLSRGNGSVQVASRLAPGFVEMEFGCLAPDANPDCWESLFAPYNPHAPSGSGLAMACARRIVRRHGGTIEVQTLPADLVAMVLRFPIEARSQADISSPT
jgi:nitrogen-specific signal transduction histidine kinase